MRDESKKSLGSKVKRKDKVKTTETRSFNLCGEPSWGAVLPGRNLTLTRDMGFRQESDIWALEGRRLWQECLT